MKSEQVLRTERIAILEKHIAALRSAVADNVITEDDHDLIGHMMRSHIHHFLHLNDKAWSLFKDMIEEVRKWRVDNKASLDVFEALHRKEPTDGRSDN